MHWPWHTHATTRPSKRARLRARRRKRLAIFTGLAIAGFLALLVGASYIPALQITRVTVSGTDVLNATALEQAVADELAGAYAFVFPRSNVLIYPADRIRAQLRATFPRIDALTLDRTGLHTVAVRVRERAPVGVWCGVARADEDTTEACYFLDADGVLFARAPSFSGSVYRRFYGPLAEGDARAGGGRYLSPATFTQVREIIDATENLGVEVVRVTQPNEVDFHIHLADGSFIKIDRRRSADAMLQGLRTTLQSTEFQQQADGKALEYIDVRFEDRVYYKFSEQ